MEDGLTYAGLQEPRKSKKLDIAKILFDKNNPELITYITDPEVTNISRIQTIVEDENKLRKKLNIPDNLFSNYMKKVLILRCSRKGWRAEQGERIIKEIIENEDNQNKGLLGRGIGSVLGKR